MIRINLLPHREEKRKARRQQFILLAALTALAGLAVWFVGHSIIAGYVEGHEAKNAFIKREKGNLDTEISENKCPPRPHQCVNCKSVFCSAVVPRTFPISRPEVTGPSKGSKGVVLRGCVRGLVGEFGIIMGSFCQESHKLSVVRLKAFRRFKPPIKTTQITKCLFLLRIRLPYVADLSNKKESHL